MKERNLIFILITITLISSIILAVILIKLQISGYEEKDRMAREDCKFSYVSHLDLADSILYESGECYYVDEYGIKNYLRYYPQRREWAR